MDDKDLDMVREHEERMREVRREQRERMKRRELEELQRLEQVYTLTHTHIFCISSIYYNTYNQLMSMRIICHVHASPAPRAAYIY